MVYDILKIYKGKLLLAIFWSILFVVIPMQIPVITGTLIEGITIKDKDKPILFYEVKISDTPAEIILFGFISLTIVAITYGIDNIITIDNGKVVDKFERTNVHKDLDNIINSVDNSY